VENQPEMQASPSTQRTKRGIKAVKKNTFIQGALILTVAGIIVKFIGAFSRIYLSRLLGGEGIGLYQMAYPIYLLCLSVSSAGLPVAISIMVAEKNAIHDFTGGQRVFRISMTALTLTGLFFSGLLFFGSSWLIDSGIITDSRAYWSLIALAPAVLFATILATMRGYFQGLQMMTPTAVSQIIEQIVRVATMILLAVWLLPYGLEYGAAGATFGAAPGAFTAILVLIYFYWKNRHWRREMELSQDKSIVPQSTWSIIKRLLVLAIPVSLSNIMLPIVSNIDLFIVPKRLSVAGFTVEQSTTLFGYLTGMATALVNMPTIVTASLAASLVPVISEATIRGQKDVVMARTQTAMRMANIITIPSFVGLCVIATPISAMLYAIPDAGPCIAVMSFGIFLLGVQQVTTGVLQGMGKTAIPFINMVVSATVKVFLSWNLTAMPSWGVLGAAWATNADFGVAALLNLVFLFKYNGYKMDMIHTLKVFISAGLMGAAVYGTYYTLYPFIHSNTLSTLAAILVGVVIYTIAVLITRAIKAEDVRGIPRIGAPLAAVIEKVQK
jgi:stage V sporulation protein B